MSLHAVPQPGDAPWPDAGGKPLWFLVEASGPVEQGLVAAWLASNRPAGATVDTIDLPTRRHRRRADLDRIPADGTEDPLLVPVRVAWLSPLRRRRVPRLLDLITLGDPRDPNRLLQRLIVRFRPDRVQVITGEPASVSDVRRRWVEARAARPDAPDGFAEFVALQAKLALEVAERRLHGNRYKVPRFLREDLLSRASFQAGLRDLARRTGEHVDDLARSTARYLDEIAATPSTFVLDLVAALIRLVYTQGYDRRIVYDEAALRRLEELGRQHSLAYLPSHKSNMDHLALTYVLYENGLPPNHAAGGVNMNFFPIGPLLRRHGIFFIRRSFKDNEAYKFVLKQYVDYLLSKRFPLEWYLEGGRSRSGKLREPKYGMLSYVADSWRRGSCDDVILVPTSIAYDQIQDVGAHAAEQRGEAKEKESLGWLVRVLRSLRRRYGRIYVNFGEPISLADVLEPYDGEPPDPEESHLEVAKLAFEVAVRINRVTPITPISLVTLALLGTGDRALTVEETHEALRGFIAFVERRGLPVTERLDPDDAEAVRRSLDELADHDVVRRVDGGTQTVYVVGPEQALKAAFYRNTIVHFFIDTAIAEVALAAAIDEPQGLDAFWDTVWALRDLLKFEFFFPEREEFAAVVAADLEDHAPGWEATLNGDAGAEAVLREVDPHAAHWVLRPVLESYLLVADALVEADPRRDVDRKALIKSCLALGEQYRLQKRITSAEAISTVLFDHAIALADNRGLLGGGGMERLREREAFADEVRELVDRLDTVEALALG